MELRTSLSLPPAPDKINLQTPALAMGSCFAEVMGERLQTNKFSALVNPFGVIFNPVSLARLLERTLANEPFNQADLIHTNEGWHHYDLHSRIWATDPDALLAHSQDILTQTRKFLESSGWLLLTLGTAFVYRRKDTGDVVANCHKIPAAHFSKELLSLPEIVADLDHVFEQLITQKPAMRILLTVSPVRHTKDTLPLNAVSKSLLRVACHQLTQKFSQVTYFPAFEIMMDDLRDYRFYKPDMIHPSEVAENYIWQQFAKAYFDESTHTFLEQWAKIQQALKHRPRHVESLAHQQFLKSTLVQLQELRGQVAVEEEIKLIEAQLIPDAYNT